jgi:hypothetical protein
MAGGASDWSVGAPGSDWVSGESVQQQGREINCGLKDDIPWAC